MKSREGFVSNSSSSSFTIKIINSSSHTKKFVEVIEDHLATLSEGEREDSRELLDLKEYMGTTLIQPNSSVLAVGFYGFDAEELSTLEIVDLDNPQAEETIEVK